ncbi:hypothetical protein [Exiguobacterium sp. s193]|uniref:hypothetical protein n=1 Tax=Exiguobacterium sp. s193 TaxID=2751207 RepID=UPI001BE94551|nr:hypothetical protein [Exiguobacterium sp. s193]
MKINYFTVQPSGKNGQLETHLLPADWHQAVDEEWSRAIHYGAGLIQVTDNGVELRIPIEFGFGYVLQYIRQFVEAERQTKRARHLLQRQLDWIGRGLSLRLQRKGAIIELTAGQTFCFKRESFLLACEKNLFLN